MEYQLGFECMIRRAVEQFRSLGLEPVCYRAAVESLNRRSNGKRGYYGTSANRQYDYDHRYDSALYMGNAFKERKLSILKPLMRNIKTWQLCVPVRLWWKPLGKRNLSR